MQGVVLRVPVPFARPTTDCKASHAAALTQNGAMVGEVEEGTQADGVDVVGLAVVPLPFPHVVLLTGGL